MIRARVLELFEVELFEVEPDEDRGP